MTPHLAITTLARELSAAGLLITAVAVLVLMFGLVLLGWLIERHRRRPLRWGGGSKKEYRRAKRGEGLGVEVLAKRLDVAERDLETFLPKYHAATIPKRSGGQRRLHVPDAPTKRMQRRILDRLLAKLNTHEAATGFEPGTSIVDNAARHAGQAVVVRMDIVDFFPSTTAERVEWYFRRVGWNAEAAKLLTLMTTHDGGLPQGAPTSPRLSNLVNFYLDVQLSNLAAKRTGVYSRYADDITFSFPRDSGRRVRGVIQHVGRLLKHHGYRLHKRKKLHVRRSHQRQVVTGLVVNDGTPRLPRKTRRWLRAVEHRVRTGGEATLTESQLAGWRALKSMVDRGAEPASGRAGRRG